MDPRMTEGGKTAEDYQRERGAKRLQEYNDRRAMLKMAGFNVDSPRYH